MVREVREGRAGDAAEHFAQQRAVGGWPVADSEDAQQNRRGEEVGFCVHIQLLSRFFIHPKQQRSGPRISQISQISRMEEDFTSILVLGLSVPSVPSVVNLKGFSGSGLVFMFRKGLNTSLPNFFQKNFVGMVSGNKLLK